PVSPKTTTPPRGASPSKAGTTANASVPKGATGQCSDGSYTRAKTQRGACSQHGGVKTWFGNATKSESATPTNTKAPTTGAPSINPAPKTPRTDTKAPTKSAAGASENATAKCKDGTYSFAKQHRGACSRHGGVAEWYK